MKNRTYRAWSSSDLAGARIGIYTRASDDHDDTGTSVDAQAGYGERWAEQHGCVPFKYCDNDRSASWFAKKGRPDFERMLRDIEAGKLDLVWFWTVNRSQRSLAVYAHLRDLCRAHSMGWVIKRKLYDLNDPADLRALGIAAVDGEVQSLEISENARLGIALAASRGKPHGKTTYGYIRQYDERGKYKAQVPHTTARYAAEIITRISKAEDISRIQADLMKRKIPNPSGGERWARMTIRHIATNLAYIGIRVHVTEDGERTETPNAWPAIVEPEVFYRAQNVLNDPARKTTRPARAVHLCSYVVHCECGEWVSAKVDKRRNRNPDGRRMYACLDRCAAIGADELDEFVRNVIDAYLAREDVREFFAAAQADDAESVAARTEISRLRGEVEDYKQLAEQGLMTATDYKRIMTGLAKRIKEEEERAELAATPPILRVGSIDWEDIAIARQFIAAVADIRLRRIGKGRRHVSMDDRISWRWLIGPDAPTEVPESTQAEDPAEPA